MFVILDQSGTEPTKACLAYSARDAYYLFALRLKDRYGEVFGDVRGNAAEAAKGKFRPAFGYFGRLGQNHVIWTNGDGGSVEMLPADERWR